MSGGGSRAVVVVVEEEREEGWAWCVVRKVGLVSGCGYHHSPTGAGMRAEDEGGRAAAAAAAAVPPPANPT